MELLPTFNGESDTLVHGAKSTYKSSCKWLTTRWYSELEHKSLDLGEWRTLSPQLGPSGPRPNGAEAEDMTKVRRKYEWTEIVHSGAVWGASLASTLLPGGRSARGVRVMCCVLPQ